VEPPKDTPDQPDDDVPDDQTGPHNLAIKIVAICGLLLLLSYGTFLVGCLLYGVYNRRNRGYAQLAVEEPREAIAQATVATQQATQQATHKGQHALKDFWQKSKEKLHIGSKN
jgi:hypothetical protein